ncbi:ClpX C4-type zinc finger protein [Brevibacillus borstelensis]|uniref:ClpX C4-type zinc finger protein n=1 Tax=Brevibacillus borstelensis TaxID=45462 RepID=UPI0030C067EE
MDQDFRKKTFRGAKIEDTIQELDKLIELCEKNRANSDSLDRQRFYEGMAIAYTTVSLKLKGEFDYIEKEVVEQLYDAAEKTRAAGFTEKAEAAEATEKAGAIRPTGTDYLTSCSFCGKSNDKAGELALGPGVSICRDCLTFGAQVIELQSSKG